VARELTKLHEEILRGPLARLRAELGERELRGEFVVAVGPS
jgi:16S rRNA (cytidine1402-2'-O)-methyltransferase